MKKLFALALFFTLVFTANCYAATLDPEIQNILSKIKDNQALVKDFQADISTVIKSSKKSMEQKGHIWVKGENNSKIESYEPVKQTTITNKDKILMLDPTTGQKMVQDLKQLRAKSGDQSLGKSPTNQAAAMEYFNLKKKAINSSFFGGKEIVLEGTPKAKGKFFGTVNFYIDAQRYLPTKIEIIDHDGNKLSTAKIDYQNIKNAWVISKSKSEINVPSGKMEIEMKFSNIKVNEGISDKEFKI